MLVLEQINQVCSHLGNFAQAFGHKRSEFRKEIWTYRDLTEEEVI